MTKRIQFIPTLQAALTAGLVSQGVPESVVKAAFDQWHANKEARTPMELGCFHVFQTVQDDINR